MPIFQAPAILLALGGDWQINSTMIVLRRFVWLLALVLLSQGCAMRRAEVFQYATINSLLTGGFDGDLTIAELKKHGDFGLGTFNALDGEMMALDGCFYQIRSDGKVVPVAGTGRTPFATVTFFQPTHTLILTNVTSLRALEQQLDAQLPARNIFLAFRIEAEVEFLKARSVPRQQPPYPTLAEAAKKQRVFELRNQTGTFVGFRTPVFMQGLNVPGYHFHFLTADRQAGGHVLDCGIRHAEIHIAETTRFRMWLPEQGDFQQRDIARDHTSELQRVESHQN